jgi:hypothetical protein
MAKSIEGIFRAYKRAKARQFGTLHERMKYLVEVARKSELWKTENDVWQAIFDLELEVCCHQPAKPPFGRRVARRWPGTVRAPLEAHPSSGEK